MDQTLADCLAIAQRCIDGAASPQITLMEMLIASEDLTVVERAVGQLGQSSPGEPALRLLRVFEENRTGCAEIAAILRAEQSAGETRSVAQSLAFCRQLFDTLVQQNEEASVALYSLGSPEILAAATAEIVDALRSRELISHATRVLDVGCGIGRMAVALAPHVLQIDAIDLSTQMVAVASRRCAQLPNVRVSLCDGERFSSVEARSKELVLAVDSFPYVVQGGEPLVQTIVSEAVRVLVPGGTFVILNFSYRGDLTRDRQQSVELAARHGMRVTALGELPFSLWNGALFSFRLD